VPYTQGLPYYVPASSSYSLGSMGGIDMYGNPYQVDYVTGPVPPETIESAQSKCFIPYSTMDGDYLYASVIENGSQSRGAFVIFGTDDSGEYVYLSHVDLLEGEGSAYIPSNAPGEIIIKDNLAVVGGNDLGMINLIDISDKVNPKLINSLKLAGNDDNGTDHVLGLAIEGQVLFVCIEDLDGINHNDKYIVYALDISDPKNMSIDNALLDSYEFDSDFETLHMYKVYSMASAPGHLYLAGKKTAEDDSDITINLTIYILDTSDPRNLSLVGMFDKLGTAPALEPELSVATDGNYLLATVEASEEFGPYATGAYRLNIIDISDPNTPQILSSSKKLDGDQFTGDSDIVVKDNYAYLIADSSMPSKAKIYTFDISNPNAPDFVDMSESVSGQGTGLSFMKDNRLCLHAGDGIAIFDMSDPANLLLVKTIDLEGLLEDEVADWGWTADAATGNSTAYYLPYPAGDTTTGTGGSAVASGTYAPFFIYPYGTSYQEGGLYGGSATYGGSYGTSNPYSSPYGSSYGSYGTSNPYSAPYQYGGIYGGIYGTSGYSYGYPYGTTSASGGVYSGTGSASGSSTYGYPSTSTYPGGSYGSPYGGYPSQYGGTLSEYPYTTPPYSYPTTSSYVPVPGTGNGYVPLVPYSSSVPPVGTLVIPPQSTTDGSQPTTIGIPPQSTISGDSQPSANGYYAYPLTTDNGPSSSTSDNEPSLSTTPPADNAQ
jgi:hypothetical protein